MTFMIWQSSCVDAIATFGWPKNDSHQYSAGTGLESEQSCDTGCSSAFHISHMVCLNTNPADGQKSTFECEVTELLN